MFPHVLFVSMQDLIWNIWVITKRNLKWFSSRFRIFYYLHKRTFKQINMDFTVKLAWKTTVCINFSEIEDYLLNQLWTNTVVWVFLFHGVLFGCFFVCFFNLILVYVCGLIHATGMYKHLRESPGALLSNAHPGINTIWILIHLLVKTSLQLYKFKFEESFALTPWQDMPCPFELYF